MLHDGHTYDSDLQISGGDRGTTFFLSAGQTNQNGVVIGPNNYYDRTSVRLKANHELTSTLHIGGNANYIDSRGGYVQRGGQVSALLLGAYPTSPDFNNNPSLDPIYGEQRSYRYPSPTGSDQTRGRGYDNSLFVANNDGAQSELGRFVGNANLDWAPNSWLALKENFGVDRTTIPPRSVAPQLVDCAHWLGDSQRRILSRARQQPAADVYGTAPGE